MNTKNYSKEFDKKGPKIVIENFQEPKNAKKIFIGTKKEILKTIETIYLFNP
jgi:hypothetical protein